MEGGPLCRWLHREGALHKVGGGLDAVPLQLGQIRQVRDGVQLLRGEHLLDIGAVVAALRQQGIVGAGEGTVRQGRRQQLLPVDLASARVVRQVDDEIRAVRRLAVEVRQGRPVCGVAVLIFRREAVDLHIPHVSAGQEQGVEVRGRLLRIG